MKTGLFIGRFQPFHLGHLSAIKQALEQVDFLTIGIGSAQYNNTDQNPFTAAERREMIGSALDENGIMRERFQVVEIPDIHSDPKWPAHVRSIVPDFEVVFTRSDIIKKLFTKYDGVPIVWLKKEIPISATEIREKMRKRGDWKKWLPKKVINIIKMQKKEL
ncbi:MAG: nicotinamide-nucleotide adenylyltransferase [Candidatus Peregrinibacteria bacterium]